MWQSAGVSGANHRRRPLVVQVEARFPAGDAAPTHAEIARLAYQCFEDRQREGRHGSAVEDWLRAEQELLTGF